jgi:hypothetical protein
VASFLTLGLGTRNVRWAPIVCPWGDDFDDVWHDVDNILFDSVFWSNADGEARPLPLVSLTPIVGIVAFAVASIYAMPGVALLITGIVMVAPIVLAMIVGLILMGVGAVWDIRCKTSSMPRPKKRHRKANAIETVICPGNGTKPAAAPRPIRLWWADMKAKVCKPYAVVDEE